MDLATALSWAAERHPGRPAVAGAGRQLNYRHWDAPTSSSERCTPRESAR